MKVKYKRLWLVAGAAVVASCTGPTRHTASDAAISDQLGGLDSRPADAAAITADGDAVSTLDARCVDPDGGESMLATAALLDELRKSFISLNQKWRFQTDPEPL